MISVPVPTETVMNTIQQLPRTPSEANLIEVGLKRKKEYNNAHKKELVNPNKIINALAHLKKSGHPYYQNFDDFDTYERRCRENDMTGHQMLFGDSDEEQCSGEDVVNTCTEGDENNEDNDDKEEANTIRK